MSHFLADLALNSVLDLTTVGRVTGRPHTIEIWFAHHEDTIYMLSGGRDRSDWVRNVMATAEVEISLGDRSYTGSARVVVDSREDRLARDAVFAKYSVRYAGDLTRWRERSLPIAVDLHRPA